MANTTNHPVNAGSFQKGDKRINQHGQRNKAAVAFGKSLREYIVKEGKAPLTLENGKKISKIEAVVRTIYKEAILGNMAAVTFLADRVEGKVKDELDLNANGGIQIRVIREGSNLSSAEPAPHTGTH